MAIDLLIFYGFKLNTLTISEVFSCFNGSNSHSSFTVANNAGCDLINLFKVVAIRGRVRRESSLEEFVPSVTSSECQSASFSLLKDFEYVLEKIVPFLWSFKD